MSSQTPTRRISLSRKRILKDDKGRPVAKRLSPSVEQRMAECISDDDDDDDDSKHNSSFCTQLINKEVIELSPDAKSSSRMKDRGSSNTQVEPKSKVILKGSANCRTNFNTPKNSIESHSVNPSLFSPDSSFTSSQIASIQDCEVFWDCNSPGFSKDDLKRKHKQSGKSISPVPQKQQTIFRRRPFGTKKEEAPCDIEENLNDLLVKINSKNDADEENLFKVPKIFNASQPFQCEDASKSCSSVTINQNGYRKEKSINLESEITDAELEVLTEDFFEKTEKKNSSIPTNDDQRKMFVKNLPSKEKIPTSVMSCSNNNNDDAKFSAAKSSTLTLRGNNTTLPPYQIPENNRVPRSNDQLEVKKLPSKTNKSQNYTSIDYFDDDLFDESVIKSTQAIEDALYDQTTGQFRSPSILKNDTTQNSRQDCGSNKNSGASSTQSSPILGKVRSPSWSKPKSFLNEKSNGDPKVAQSRILKSNRATFSLGLDSNSKLAKYRRDDTSDMPPKVSTSSMPPSTSCSSAVAKTSTSWLFSVAKTTSSMSSAAVKPSTSSSTDAKASTAWTSVAAKSSTSLTDATKSSTTSLPSTAAKSTSFMPSTTAKSSTSWTSTAAKSSTSISTAIRPSTITSKLATSISSTAKSATSISPTAKSATSISSTAKSATSISSAAKSATSISSAAKSATTISSAAKSATSISSTATKSSVSWTSTAAKSATCTKLPMQVHPAPTVGSSTSVSQITTDDSTSKLDVGFNAQIDDDDEFESILARIDESELGIGSKNGSAAKMDQSMLDKNPTFEKKVFYSSNSVSKVAVQLSKLDHPTASDKRNPRRKETDPKIPEEDADFLTDEDLQSIIMAEDEYFSKNDTKIKEDNNKDLLIRNKISSGNNILKKVKDQIITKSNPESGIIPVGSNGNIPVGSNRIIPVGSNGNRLTGVPQGRGLGPAPRKSGAAPVPLNSGVVPAPHIPSVAPVPMNSGVAPTPHISSVAPVPKKTTFSLSSLKSVVGNGTKTAGTGSKTTIAVGASSNIMKTSPTITGTGSKAIKPNPNAVGTVLKTSPITARAGLQTMTASNTVGTGSNTLKTFNTMGAGSNNLKTSDTVKTGSNTLKSSSNTIGAGSSALKTSPNTMRTGPNNLKTSPNIVGAGSNKLKTSPNIAGTGSKTTGNLIKYTQEQIALKKAEALKKKKNKNKFARYPTVC